MAQSPRRAALQDWFEQVDTLLAGEPGRPLQSVPQARCELRRPMALRRVRRSLGRLVVTTHPGSTPPGRVPEAGRGVAAPD